jgi:hypothetical protein
MNHIDLATFLVDCLAIRETERIPCGLTTLWGA